MTLSKRTIILGACLTLAACCAGVAGQEAPPAAAPAAASPRVLRHILIAESVEAAQQLTVPPGSPFVVFSPGLPFDAAELNKRLAAGENRPIDERILAAAAQVIEAYFHTIDYPAASIVIPTQNIATGEVRFLLTLGEKSKAPPVTASSEWRIRNINVQGARWFSESLLREKLRIEQGGTVRFSELDQAISWTNNNPFRRVRVQLVPVPNTGEADLAIAVQDALPLRVGFTVDNAGNDVIGNTRFTGSVSYGNLWGKDHQASYQYITSDKPSIFKAHGLDYRVPLPWRHYIQLSASYLQANPEFYEGLFLQKGETITSDLRYTVPLRTGLNSAEVYAALNFKQSDNNLTWDPHGYNLQASHTTTDVFQLTLGGNVVFRDRLGAWAFAASLTGSPGGINSRNTDRAFDAGRYGNGDSARFGAKAMYAYGSISAQRLLTLKPGWDLMSRALLQLSEANLLPSEQMTIGGNASVRGYNENIYAGDHGIVFSNDLMAPAWKVSLPSLSKTRGPLETRPLFFFDAGNTGVRHHYPSDQKRVPLYSTGLGVRMSFSTNFSLSADYGWQLGDLPYAVDERSRSHIRATLAF